MLLNLTKLSILGAAKRSKSKSNWKWFSISPVFKRIPIYIPDAVIGGDLASATSRDEYESAKSGNIDAALAMACELVTQEMTDRVSILVAEKKPLVVPIASVEASGRNKIPAAVAVVLANKLGLDVYGEIVQSNTPKRSAMDGFERLFSSPIFDGPVEAGRDYLLVDDTLTQGGTFASLYSYIKACGGDVVGAVALTGKAYSATLTSDPSSIEKLRGKYDILEESFEKAAGHDFSALTNSEVRYLSNFKPAERLRRRVFEAGESGQYRGHAATDGRSVSFLDRLPNIKFKNSVTSLINEGRVVVSREPPDDAPLGVQAWTSTDGIIHILEWVDGTRAKATLLHEVFHASIPLLLNPKTQKHLIANLAGIYRQALSSKSELDQIWTLAAERVSTAIEQGDPNLQTRDINLLAEELGAYAVEIYENASSNELALFDKLMSWPKAIFLAYLSIQAGRVTPGQLHAISLMCMSRKGLPPQQSLADNRFSQIWPNRHKK